MQGTKMNTFTTSKAWLEAHKLVLVTYRFLRAFPTEEQFSLKNQMQQASVAITTNIAKGYANEFAADKLQCFMSASTSMIEFHNCLLISRDVGYLKAAYYDEISRQMMVVNKQIAGLIATAKKEM